MQRESKHQIRQNEKCRNHDPSQPSQAMANNFGKAEAKKPERYKQKREAGERRAQRDLQSKEFRSLPEDGKQSAIERNRNSEAQLHRPIEPRRAPATLSYCGDVAGFWNVLGSTGGLILMSVICTSDSSPP